MITGHGGNVQALAAAHNCAIDDIIDMSSNINPLGPPEGLEEFIARNVSSIRTLPQPDAAHMTQAFSQYYDIPEERVAGGNGTTFFIYSLPGALSSKRVLIAGPTYADYRDACLMHQVPSEFTMAPSSYLFQPDLDAISQRLSKEPAMDTVMICNPNNPTGNLIPRDDLMELVRRHHGVFFIIDESYLPFLPDAEKLSLVPLTSLPNLIVLASMSKIFRIPGLRTGFLCAAPSVVEKIMAFYQPWSVNSLAQDAIVHILKNPGIIDPFLERTRLFIKNEREIFLGEFENNEKCRQRDNLPLKWYPSHTCFLLARLTGSMNSREAVREVGKERILIRDCANFQGLSDQFIRISLRSRKDNLLLADILKKIIV
ncbi:MAG: pyridoxal phosphate-dependent class II aminotransferase [Desulfamplus sp.]|nr:pyridoxal phosphate-dependent class II aminotransferase [Desulfamplus sp.]